VDDHTGIDLKKELGKINAFPVPSNGIVSVSLPAGSSYRYRIVNTSGQVVGEGTTGIVRGSCAFNLEKQGAGVYFILLTADNGSVYRVKVIRK
jgi:hypothetical protein